MSTIIGIPEIHNYNLMELPDSGSIGLSSDYYMNLAPRTPIGPSSKYSNSWSYCIRMACVARIGQCLGLLGATLDVRPSDTPGETQALDDDEQGAAAVVAAEELHIDGA
ncbi:hypothetical protein BDD12DRAFT_912990 [Trichophaea hybrida]|nr:hypothetical protein BDD12DRAFT_912990 [Trichophaea hybrida]